MLKRLSLDERRNFPYTWTPDGKSVVFTSDRDGVFHLFKQAIDQPAPDLLVGGDQSVTLARLNAELRDSLHSQSRLARHGPASTAHAHAALWRDSPIGLRGTRHQ